MATLYEFLGIEPEASPDEIKAAAQRLAKKFHPTKYPGNKRIATRFKKIKLVYNTLANPKKRAAYDAALAKQMAKIESAQTKSVPDAKNNISHKPQQNQVLNSAEAKTESFELDGSERIIYRAKIHWIAYLKTLFLIGISTYFLWFNPSLLTTIIENLSFLQGKRQYVNLGLQIVLGLGILMLLQIIFQQLTTTLMMTSQGITAQFGLFSKRKFRMDYIHFEHIEIKQSLLGQILDFGTLKIRGKSGGNVKGVGGIKIHISNIVSPKKFEKRLMRMIKQSSYHQI
jgi:uncharacterized membrane protein YdbT with pleckstrin-like domain